MSHRTLSSAHGYLEGVDRLRLHYRAWEADHPRAALIVVHGMFEHSRRYQELGAFMAEGRLSTYALDLRGHGVSEGRRGHARRFALFLQDLDRFRREVQGLVPQGTPVFLLGHSLGGLIVLRYLEEYDTPILAAVVTAPWLGTAVPVPRWQVVLAGILNRTLPAFPFPFHIDAATLSHDPGRVADYQDDGDIHSTITPRLFTEISTAIHQAMERGDRIQIPIRLLLAGDDRLVDTARSLEFARSLNPERVSVEVLDGLFHELLQERDRRQVMSEVRGFFLEHLD